MGKATKVESSDEAEAKVEAKAEPNVNVKPR